MLKWLKSADGQNVLIALMLVFVFTVRFMTKKALGMQPPSKQKVQEF